MRASALWARHPAIASALAATAAVAVAWLASSWLLNASLADGAAPGATLSPWHAPAPAQDGPAAAPAERIALQPLTSRVWQAQTPADPAGPRAVPVAVSAPRKLLVGEQPELVLALPPNTEVSELAFTVQFDGSVVQARDGRQGEWATGSGAPVQFSAEISPGEDRITVRSSASDRGDAGRGGSVAVLQFQGIAPGATMVMVSDVVARDWAGRQVPVLLASSMLQLSVESLPPTR